MRYSLDAMKWASDTMKRDGSVRLAFKWSLLNER